MTFGCSAGMVFQAMNQEWLSHHLDKLGFSDLLCVITGFQNYGGPGSLSHDFKYSPSLSKAMGPVDPSLLVVKNLTFNKKYSPYSESMNKTKILITNGNFSSNFQTTFP